MFLLDQSWDAHSKNMMKSSSYTRLVTRLVLNSKFQLVLVFRLAGFSIPTGRLRFAIYIVYLEKSGELVNLKKSAEMQECPCQRHSCSKCKGRCKKV